MVSSGKGEARKWKYFHVRTAIKSKGWKFYGTLETQLNIV